MGKRVKEVSLAEATPDTRAIYQRVFGDKDPVAQPGTSTGSPGDYWTTLALVPEERAVMAATDELIGRNMIEDATFAELKRNLSDEQIVELFYVITTYRMHGMMLRALHLEFDNDTTTRMQEVPAPAAKA
jgi:hypothetical protein